MFNFDDFINRPCVGARWSNGTIGIGLFAQKINYIPANSEILPFLISGVFRKNYQEISVNNSDAAINSEQIVLFIRDKDWPAQYLESKQGDFVEVENIKYQIIDIRPEEIAVKKLVLHEYLNA